MSIGNVGAAGGVVFSNIDTKSMPLQLLTQLVMAETMMTREKEQEQKVEEIAAQNAKAKEYNDALATITRLGGAFAADASNLDRRSDGKNLPEADLNQWKKAATATELKLADGTTVSLAGKTFEQRLELLAKTSPPLSETSIDFLRDRAKLADIAQTYGMLPGGKESQGMSYENIAKGDLTKGTLDTIKTKFKTAAEAISTNNQLEMIKRQQLIGAVDAAKTALTQFVKTAGDAEKEIVQKF